ncbi:hypothetical protein JCM19294_1732 [Nonlabens tegetincola]|uniref:RNA polymerase subunit sigma-24 n=1 Tax=Nonlabens tegetincola TaxID=323273 RepID=A0A090PZE7_9FLAO|nr:sigma-70 family RNA polymerase sigma factor [Nonlabens tegetincola]MEE2800963.1 sigma-70 family RNA polymerase sigma factor [Bacteroidota bacterium]GAK96219.1 hypothetical protein JCM19294_1732 [Nonlabens tegetincola]
MNHQQEETIYLLKSGDRSYYEKIYLHYKQDFKGYALKRGIPLHDVDQLYQDSFVQLYQNVATGKLTTLTSSLKTYLFGIGNYKMMEYYKSKGTYVNLDTDNDIKQENPMMFFEEQSLTENQNKLYTALNKIGTRCRNILELFYLQGLSIKEILATENYSSENTVKAQKSRCLKQLKELANKADG